MEALMSALIILALFALSIVAYQQPETYKKIFGLLSTAYMMTFASMLFWHVCNELMYVALLPYISSSEADNAQATLVGHQVPGWVVILGIGLFIYMTFLLWLPTILGDAPKQRNEAVQETPAPVKKSAASRLARTKD